MVKVVKNNLGFLGNDFQYRLINAFVEDPSFFRDLVTIIDQNMFTEPHLRTIVGVMKEAYDNSGTVPDYSLIDIILRSKAKTEDDLDYYTETLDKLKEYTTLGIREVEDMAEKFFKQQNWVRVSNQIREIVGDGDISRFDECQKLMEEAISVGRKDDAEHSPFENIDGILSDENIVSIPTGVDRLDEVLGGGLDKGKIGLIIAGAGSGKTSMTTGFCEYAATYRCKNNDFNGYKVLHIFVEDSVRDISRKYVSRITQIETSKLNESKETNMLAKKLLKENPNTEMVKDNVKLLRVKNGRETATSIRDKIIKKMNEGFMPDMVVIDYFECLDNEKGYKNEAKWDQEARTMRRLESMAQELNIALWLPTQGNRGGLAPSDGAILTMDNVQGSIKKVQIAQVVLSITRSTEDLNNQKATLAILKNRSGNAGMVLEGVKFNNGTCTISCDPVMMSDDDLMFN